MKLWNKNFTYSFIGSIISAIGGIGLSLGLSVFVYTETNSTMMSAIFACLSMVPQFILPIFIGTLIDRIHPVKVLVINEIILSIFFLLGGIYLYLQGFSFIFLVIINFITSSLGVISQLSSSSILPKVMSVSNFNKGNAIMNMIYPLCSVAATPLIMWVISEFGVSILFIICAICSLIDALIERMIDVEFSFTSESQESKSFKQDVKEGMNYVKNTKSIRSIYFFFVAVMMLNSVQGVLLYPYFYNTAGFGSENYALALSLNSLGYLCGGLFLYKVEIPHNKRFLLSSGIFIFFILAEGFMFSIPLPLLLVTRFLAGFLGSQSANFRISAILALVPDYLLGKVNAVFSVMINLAIFLSQGLIGFLGEQLPYQSIALGFACIQLLAFLFFFLPSKNNVKEIYNYSSE